MATKQEQIDNNIEFVNKVGTDMKEIRLRVGKLSELSTGNKTNIVSSVNEVFDTLGDSDITMAHILPNLNIKYR